MVFLIRKMRTIPELRSFKIVVITDLDQVAAAHAAQHAAAGLGPTGVGFTRQKPGESFSQKR